MQKSIIIILFLTGLSFSCNESRQPGSMINRNSEDNSHLSAKKLRYLALGDSYTIGESVADHEHFPAQLAQQLRESGILIDDPEIIAQTGWSTGQLIAGIAAANPPENFDLVTLLIGVNNQYRGLDTAEYRLEFRQLFQQSVRFANGSGRHVIVLSIPDYSVTPFAANGDTAKIAREIAIFNAINLSETRNSHAVYSDITGISRSALNDRQLLADDGLHPSGKMYAKWVELILPEVKSILLHKNKSE
jgi:lysophospholipase L1-like esterase